MSNCPDSSSPADEANGDNADHTNHAENLFGYIKENKEEDFINDPNLEEHVNSVVNERTLLQHACKQNRIIIVRTLLTKRANPEKVANENDLRPLEIAAKEGYYKIFDILLRYCTPLQITLPNLLGDLHIFPKENVNHRVCLLLLLQSYKVKTDEDTRNTLQGYKIKTNTWNMTDINCPDKFSHTPLHLSARYADSEITGLLLELGASLANKNLYGYLPIENIDSNTLNRYFDSCIKSDYPQNDNETKVSFNYTSLFSRKVIPEPEANASGITFDSDNSNSSNNNPDTNCLNNETEIEAIYAMTKTPDLCQLLAHPLIESFILIKWHLIRWVFYSNLISFSIFYILIFFFSVRSFWILLFLVPLVLRELFKTKLCNFRSKENYLFLSLVMGLIAALMKDYIPAVYVLSSLAMLCELGLHTWPYTNVTMLKVVTFTYLKSLVWYSILIKAFTYTFYNIFNKGEICNQLQNEDNQTGKTCNRTQYNEIEEHDDFDNMHLSVIKTILMFTGEFDIKSEKLENLPNTLMFISFVICITIVLNNLLIGLAVSDVQEIRNQAKIMLNIERVKYIYTIEHMSMKVLPCEIVLLKWLFIEPDKVEVLINQDGRVVTTKNNRYCEPLDSVKLDKETIAATKLILQANVNKELKKTKKENNAIIENL